MDLLSRLLALIFLFNCCACVEEEYKPSLDSQAKWMMYVLNFEYDAVGENDIKGKRFDFISCSILDRPEYFHKSDDTLIMLYAFSCDQSSTLYLGRPNYCAGLKIHLGRIVYPICDIDLLKNKSKDSIEIFFIEQEKKFENYLIQHDGSLNDWLHSEAIKRGVLTR